jgi:hypothetical protein
MALKLTAMVGVLFFEHVRTPGAIVQDSITTPEQLFLLFYE